LLHVRERTWAITIDLTCRQRKPYSPLPRWLQISVANILVLRAGLSVLPKSNQELDVSHVEIEITFSSEEVGSREKALN
ncbi:hypothetical protein T08_12411, partial [Trichinella sp. T8]